MRMVTRNSFHSHYSNAISLLIIAINCLQHKIFRFLMAGMLLVSFGLPSGFTQTTGIDLEVSSVTVTPTSINAGESISVAVVIRNIGDTDSWPFQCEIVVLPTSPFLGKYPRVENGVAAGKEISLGPVDIALPADLPTGSYYVRIGVPDSYSNPDVDMNNNTIQIPLEIKSPYTIDLQLTSIISDRTSVPEGGVLYLSPIWTNHGNTQPSNTYTKFVLSNNDSYDDADTYLGGIFTNTIDPGQISIPKQTVPGDYYIVGCIDPGNWVIETNETNNCMSIPIKIINSEGIPDLRMSGCDLSNIPYSGDPFITSCQIYNDSNVEVGPFKISAFLENGEEKIDIGNVPFVGMPAGSVLNTGTLSFYIPETVKPGEYLITFCADSDNAIIELSEGNNCRRQAYALMVDGRRDLEIASSGANPSSGPANEWVSISYTLKNNGYDLKTHPKMAFIWSQDSSLNPADLAILTWSGSEMKEHTQITESRTLRIPFNAAPGTYYLGICADWTNEIEETNENNNCSITPINVTAVGGTTANQENLEVQGVTTDVLGVAPGDTVNLYFSVKNNGTSNVTTAYIGFALLRDPAFSPPITSDALKIENLEAGESRFLGPVPFPIAKSTPSGRAYVYVTIKGKQIGNDAAMPLYIGDSPATRDLIVRGTSIGQISLGESFGTTIGMQNASQAALLQSTKTEIRWSSNPTRSPEDHLVASFIEGFLDANALTSHYLRITIPRDAPSVIYLTTCVDAMNFVLETDESNNCFTEKVATDLPSVSIEGLKLRISDFALSKKSVRKGDNANASFSVSIANKLTKNEQEEGYAELLWTTNPFRTDGDRTMGRVNFVPIYTGDVRSFNVQLQIPWDMPAGTYFVGVCAYYHALGISEVEDCQYTPINLYASQTNDLRNSNVVLSSNSGHAGDTIGVTFTSTNDGTVGTNEFATAIWWSDDMRIDRNVDSIMRMIGWGSLGVFETAHVGPLTIQTPKSAVPGTYYIAVCADESYEGYGFVVETNENNNCAYAPFLIEGGNPDRRAVVEIQGITPNIEHANPGDEVLLSWRIKNSGAMDTGPIQIQIGINTAPLTYTDGYIQLATLSTLNIPGETSQSFGPISFQVPPSLQLGPAYLMITATEGNGFTDIQNTPFLVGNAQSPDLQAYMQIPSSISRGTPISLAISIFNDSLTSQNLPTQTLVYWSPDPMFSHYDYVLGALRIPSLAAGGHHIAHLQANLPDDIPVGTIYITVCSDATNVVEESDETNNCETLPLTVNYPGFLANKYKAIDFFVNKSFVAPGESITASYSVILDNPAMDAPGAKTAVSAYFLWSKDLIFDQQDIVIEEIALGDLSAGSRYSFNTPLLTPADAMAGGYNLGICTWSDNTPVELAGMYDCNSIPISVQSPKTNDLVISNLGISSRTGNPGDTVWLSFNVTNSGNVATPIFANSVRLSSDDVFTADDPELRNLPCGELGPLETLPVGPIAVSIPDNLKSRTYYFGVCADLNTDGHVQVTEPSKSDNCASIPFTITQDETQSSESGNLRW